jgi:dTDP-4-amino-4,6-dideoxygalactose transaminase
MLGPFRALRTRFFRITEQLQVADFGWIQEVRENDIVVFIDYFGFKDWDQAGELLAGTGAWVVEDASHALLNSSFSECAHYVIFSPRKFLGVPDGGILIARRNAPIPIVDLPPVPSNWWLEAMTASLLRAEFDRHGGDRKWFQLFQRTEPYGPIEPCQMSQLSELILKHYGGYSECARKRRDNFRSLARLLANVAIYVDLPDETVPLGFPVRLSNRDAVQRYFFAHDIFPPVHWNLIGLVPDEYYESHQLALQILTLPIDQRYGEAEMNRMSELLKNVLSNE